MTLPLFGFILFLPKFVELAVVAAIQPFPALPLGNDSTQSRRRLIEVGYDDQGFTTPNTVTFGDLMTSLANRGFVLFELCVCMLVATNESEK